MSTLQSLCNTTTKASRTYIRRLLKVTILYLLVTIATDAIFRHYHPHGLQLYLLAILPTLPMLATIAVIGLYIREETDEFQRLLLIRSLLGALAGVMGLSAYLDFLRSFQVIAGLPPFMEFVVFWALFAALQVIQSLRNRSTTND